MPLDRETRNTIIKFITPFLDNSERQKILNDAFFGISTLTGIDKTGSNGVFASTVVDACILFGELDDGTHSLVRLLITLQDKMGRNKQEIAESLIDRINAPASQQVAPTQEIVSGEKKYKPLLDARFIAYTISFIVFTICAISFTPFTKLVTNIFTPDNTPTATIEPLPTEEATTTETPASVTPTNEPSSTPQQSFTGLITVREDALTLYIRDNGVISLEGLAYEYTIEGDEQQKLLTDYFPVQDLNAVNTPVCFRLLREGADITPEAECPDNSLTQMLETDVWWQVDGNRQDFDLVQNGAILVACTGNNLECVVTSSD